MNNSLRDKTKALKEELERVQNAEGDIEKQIEQVKQITDSVMNRIDASKILLADSNTKDVKYHTLVLYEDFIKHIYKAIELIWLQLAAYKKELNYNHFYSKKIDVIADVLTVMTEEFEDISGKIGENKVNIEAQHEEYSKVLGGLAEVLEEEKKIAKKSKERDKENIDKGIYG